MYALNRAVTLNISHEIVRGKKYTGTHHVGNFLHRCVVYTEPRTEGRCSKKQLICVYIDVRQKGKRYSSHGEARTLNLEITIIVKVSRASQLCHAGWNHAESDAAHVIYRLFQSSSHHANRESILNLQLVQCLLPYNSNELLETITVS